MPRQQIQLPNVVGAQPQASPTNQFVQAKLREPAPKILRDLGAFSATWTGIMAQADADAHERAFAEGEMAATYTRPFGDGTPQTPEMEANRKAFKAAQENGTILPSEDPHYRIGVLTAEGRRAALTAHQAITSGENLNRAARIYDEHGNYILPEHRPDAGQMYDAQAQAFMQAPALQTIYGQKAAADIYNSSRAEFITKVSALRDAHTQQYHETQVADQIVGMLGRVHQSWLDKSTEGTSQFQDAQDGVNDLVNEGAAKWNLPDGPAVARQAFASFIEQAGQKNPQEALDAGDIIRNLKIGSTTVGQDNSENGLAFRLKLDAMESDYDSAAISRIGRKAAEIQRNRTIAIDGYRKGLSEMFIQGAQAGDDPAATERAARLRIEQGDSTYATDGLKELADTYKAFAQPMELSPESVNAVNESLLHKSPDDVRLDIEAGHTAGDWDAVGRNKLLAIVADAETVLANTSVKRFETDLEASIKSLKAGKNSDAATKFDEFSDTLLAQNRKAVLDILDRTPQGDRKAIEAALAPVFAATQADLKTYRADLDKRLQAFTAKRQTQLGQGISSQADIMQAESDGLITVTDGDSYLAKDAAATDISSFVAMSERAATQAIGTLSPDVRATMQMNDPGKLLDITSEAQMEARKWIGANRKTFTTSTDFMQAYQDYLTNDLSRKLRTSLTGADASASTVATGEQTIPQEATYREQKARGEGFQKVIDSGNSELIAASASAAYLLPKGIHDTDGLERFAASFGGSGNAMIEARRAVRADLVTLSKGANPVHGMIWDSALKPENAPIYKKALLAAGAATPQELLAGRFDDFNMSFAPEDVDPWKTPFFRTTAEWLAWSKQPEQYHELYSRFGILESDLSAWEDVQVAILAANHL